MQGQPEDDGPVQGSPSSGNDEKRGQRGESAPPPLTPPPPPNPGVEPIDAGEIRRAFSLTVEEGGFREIRIIGARTGPNGKPSVLHGYFDSAETLITALHPLRWWKGVYITLNPPVEGLECRSLNRLASGNDATKDHDIARRHDLLIDLDPERPSGIPSTEEEHENAIQRAREIRTFLISDESGWAEPVLIDSGNGTHLRFRIDLATKDEGLVKDVLHVLDHLFSDELVNVDKTVCNAARIARLPGTIACKGDATETRPHRIARVLEGPDVRDVVTEAQMRTFVESNREADGDAAASSDGGSDRARVRPAGHTDRSRHSFDVEAFIDRHPIEVSHVAPWAGGTKWVLDRCPMDDTHEVDKAAWIAQFPSGAVAAGCQHDRCNWRWFDLRRRFEPRPDPVQGRGQFTDVHYRGASRLVAGDRVRAGDRNNIGAIVDPDVGGGGALVHFVSREGVEADKEIPIAELTVVDRGDVEDTDPRSIRIYTLAELADLPSQPWVLPGVLRRREFAVVYGQPGSAKTFLALDLACHLAAGITWHAGRSPSRKMRVLYISAEGGHEDIMWRTRAWIAGIGNDPASPLIDANLRVVPEAVQIVGGGDLEGLQIAAGEAYEGGEKPDLIVFDTLARCAVDVEENSSREMGKLIARVDHLRERSDAAIVLVHHEGKDGAGRERGSSALRGAADLMIRVTKGDKGKKEAGQRPGDGGADLVEVQCDKAKRQRPFDRFSLTLRTERFDSEGQDGIFDEDGERIASAFLAVSERDAHGSPMFGDGEEARVCAAVVDTLRHSFKADEEPSTSELLVALDSRDVKKRLLYRHRVHGQKIGLFDWKKVGRTVRWSLPPEPPEQTSESQPDLYPRSPQQGVADDLFDDSVLS